MLVVTDSLVLRPLDRTDRALYIQLYTDAAVMRYIGACLKTEVASASFDKALALQGSQRVFAPRWVLLDTGTNQRCGLLGLFADGPAAELGLMLLPSAQGRGLGAALTLKGLHHLAAKLSGDAQGADSGSDVMLYVEADNSAAVKTYRRLGFDVVNSDVAYATPAAADLCSR